MKKPYLKIALIATALALLPSVLITPSLASNQHEELYNFCSKFPYNSRCEGYDRPIPLSERSGNNAECIFTPSSNTKYQDCKLELLEDKFILFVEAGDRISVLGNKRNTREIAILMQDIVSIDRREFHRDNKTEGAFWGGLIGAALADSDEFLEIELGLKQEVIVDQSPAHILTLLMDQESGVALIDQLRPYTQHLGNIPPEFDQEEINGAVESQPATDQLIRQLKTTKACRGCDLHGANLQGANLTGVNLMEANLERANLATANLENANLSGAILRHVNLENAVLRRATLKTHNKRRADLRNANLQGADLSNAKLKGANMNGADLEGANLAGADLDDHRVTKMSGWSYEFHTSLRQANLNQVNLSKADLDEARLEDATLSGATLVGTSLKRANLNHADLRNANLQDVDLRKASLVEANLEGAQLRAVNLKKTNLAGANLNGATLSNTHLQAANLCGVSMPDGTSSRQGCVVEAVKP